MTNVRWGIVGVGDVCEVKSGPGFQRATGSELVAVMRRDRAKAEDFARRHGVPRVHRTADELIHDSAVDAVYIATHPNSHCEIALKVAAANKPCLVEKPMAMNHAECMRMVEAFAAAGVPLWVAYYRRALERFTLMRDLVAEGAIGDLTAVRVALSEPLAGGERITGYRFDPALNGGGLFMDMGSHMVDLMDFYAGPIEHAMGFSVNTGRAYATEDVTVGAFGFSSGIVGTGTWNFNADRKVDELVLTGTRGEMSTAVFGDADVVVATGDGTRVHHPRNPPHVHQPLIQTIVHELHGRGACPSTGISGARASWAMDRCLGRLPG
jgi:1,5-anhydro-D-fructose reductase (1,5-anhydro-D-mannitol-forming)